MGKQPHSGRTALGTSDEAMAPTASQFIVPYCSRQQLTNTIVDALQGKSVRQVAYPNSIIEPKVGLFFAEDAPPYCFECTIRRYDGQIRVWLYLCKRQRARVDLLVIIPGCAAAFCYPDTDSVDAIAWDCVAQFWARTGLQYCDWPAHSFHTTNIYQAER